MINPCDDLADRLANAEAELTQITDVLLAFLNAHDKLGLGVVISTTRHIEYANGTFCMMSGYTLEELVSQGSFFDLVPASERDKLMERRRRREAGEPVEDHYTTAILHKSGRWVDMEAVVELAHRDGVPVVIAIVRDLGLR